VNSELEVTRPDGGSDAENEHELETILEASYVAH
jgi:hypothetical protein